jgi:hypothetical protein
MRSVASLIFGVIMTFVSMPGAMKNPKFFNLGVSIGECRMALKPYELVELQ